MANKLDKKKADGFESQKGFRLKKGVRTSQMFTHLDALNSLTGAQVTRPAFVIKYNESGFLKNIAEVDFPTLKACGYYVNNIPNCQTLRTVVVFDSNAGEGTAIVIGKQSPLLAQCKLMLNGMLRVVDETECHTDFEDLILGCYNAPLVYKALKTALQQ